jgi:hypothetical protein
MQMGKNGRRLDITAKYFFQNDGSRPVYQESLDCFLQTQSLPDFLCSIATEQNMSLISCAPSAQIGHWPDTGTCLFAGIAYPGTIPCRAFQMKIFTLLGTTNF